MLLAKKRCMCCTFEAFVLLTSAFSYASKLSLFGRETLRLR